MERHETARKLLDRVCELEMLEFEAAIGSEESSQQGEQRVADEKECRLHAIALRDRLLAAGHSIRLVPPDFSNLRRWLDEARKLEKTLMELFEEMDGIPSGLLAEKYGEIEAHGEDQPPDLDLREAMSDPDQIPHEGLVFAYRQEAIAMRVRYMARGFNLPPVPDGWLNIVQWLLDADKIVTARQDNGDRAEDGTDESKAVSASKQAGFSSEANTYRCPSWDSVVTTQEIKRVEREFGTLAGTLADLALMVREMDHIAPREIDLTHRVEVVVEPTVGVRELADEAELAEDARIDAMTGEGLSPDRGLTAWQSQETAGFLIRILASARMLRPKIEMVIGDGQARDCYVNLHRTLTYRDHTALLHKTGGGPVLRQCMQWKGVDGSVEKLATTIEHWHRNLLLMVSGDGPKTQAERDPTPNREPVEVSPPKARDWGKISIEIIDEDTARYRVNDDPWKRATYAELGFVDKRKGLPNKLWGLFKTLAQNCTDGRVQMRTVSTVSKDMDRIRSTLRAFFGLSGIPFGYDKKARAYRIKFRLKDGRQNQGNPNTPEA